MGYQIIEKISQLDDLVKTMPVSEEDLKSIRGHRSEIENILKNEDPRLLVILGPCSAWPSEAVIEYASRLKEANEKYKDKLKLVMRVYTQKPRTVKGWTGPIFQPDPFEPADVSRGIIKARELMLKIIKMGLAIADEALFINNMRFFLELLSWVAIGARSGEDQMHRDFASSLDIPVGIKNPTHGSLKVAVNNVNAVQHSHYMLLENYAVKTDGNEFAHVVLRGCNGMSNYSPFELHEIRRDLIKHHIKNPSIIIDVSHDNSILGGIKDYTLQPHVLLNIYEKVKNDIKLKPLVKGFMLESFLKNGRQTVDNKENLDLGGLSITDACIGWDESAQLLQDLYKIYKA